MSGYLTGVRAENLAAVLLRLKGYRILARRYKTPVGEIDLIARRGRVTVFVEVKARAAGEDALHALQPRQIARIVRAAGYYAAGGGGGDMRFDVIAVSGRWRVRHIRDAFQG